MPVPSSWSGRGWLWFGLSLLVVMLPWVEEEAVLPQLASGGGWPSGALVGR